MATTAVKRRSLTAEMVSQALRQRILREGLAPGARLPGYWELARDFDVAYVTVKRGVDALVAAGVVNCVNGKGIFVAEKETPQSRILNHAMLIFPTSLHHVMSHIYSSELARGVLSALEPGHGVIRSMLSEGIIYGDHVASLNPSAVIMMGVENDEYLRMALNWGRPMVAVDYCSEAVPIDFVACDNRAAARRCVEHLAELGHRRLAYGGGPNSEEIWMMGEHKEVLVQCSSDVRERREGVLAAAADLGLPEPRVIGPELSLEQAFAAGVDRPTALILQSDLQVPNALRRLAEMGLRIPDDVSVCAVVGSGDLRGSPKVAHCKFDFFAMGQKAVEVLRAQMARPGKPVNRIHRVGFKWMKGRSTREARA